MELTLLIMSALSIFVVGARSDSPDLFTTIRSKSEECLKEVNVNKEMVDVLFKEGVFTEDKNLKCFLHCLHIKINFINENGVVNVEEIKKLMLPLAPDKAETTANIEKCASIKESDECETSFKIAKCLMVD